MDINHIPLEARYEYRGTQYARIKRVESAQLLHRAFAFDLFDAKAREFGYSYSIYREYHLLGDTSDRTIVPVKEVDDYLEQTYIVYPHSLRDGKWFGAIPTASHKRFRDEGDAIRYGDQLVERARKAAAKKSTR